MSGSRGATSRLRAVTGLEISAKVFSLVDQPGVRSRLGNRTVPFKVSNAVFANRGRQIHRRTGRVDPIGVGVGDVDHYEIVPYGCRQLRRPFVQATVAVAVKTRARRSRSLHPTECVRQAHRNAGSSRSGPWYHLVPSRSDPPPHR